MNPKKFKAFLRLLATLVLVPLAAFLIVEIVKPAVITLSTL